MKRAMILSLCLLMVAGVALAAKPGDASKSARDYMKPIMYPVREWYESFENGVPPEGWTAVVNNPYTWEQGTSPIHGSFCASCFYDPTYSGPQDEWIYVDYEVQSGDVCLCFYAMGSYYWAIDPYQNYNFFVTVDGAVVWDYVSDQTANTSWVYEQYCIDISGYSPGDVIEIGFGYEGYDGAQASFDLVQIGECWPDFPPEPEGCCPSEIICYAHDFNETACGATPVECGIGPIPWQWGVPVGIPTVACDDVPVTNVWGTNLAGDYPVQTGEGLVVGPFDITDECYCLELCHYYDIEFGFDGGNVKVSTDGGITWSLVYPFNGYDDILDSTYYIAECVAGEEVFTGQSDTFLRECFDLTEYIGQSIMVGFFFGSDSSVTYPGWYLKWVKIGGDEYSPVEETSWGAIKAMYR
ncbi:MAG: hypothetical protein GF400_02085 [Candidatus Eisenbacteria bacterium]|nr:hypothetical protein [Candidatus Eisenbacteria bacterium]